VSVYPCNVCKSRRPGKMASAYWAWFRTDSSRAAFKIRYCLECAQEHLSILLADSVVHPESSNVFACVSCGADASEDSEPVYCTLYLPKREPMEYALQLDGACAVKLKATISTNGDPLEDRGSGVRGPSPDISAWDKLGLAPS
jgi:hypothetical protein